MTNATFKWLAAAVLAAALLVYGLLRTWGPGTTAPGPSAGAGKELQVFCAVSLRSPLEELAREYEREYGTRINLQFGGSGTLLATVASTGHGDLYLPADGGYIAKAREKNLAGEVMNLAVMKPVLAVAKGNPKAVKGWADVLHRRELKVGLCNPGLAAIGAVVQAVVRERGEWEALEAASDVTKTTVAELAVDLKAGALDATFLWDQMVAETDDLDTLPCPELAGHEATVPVVVLKCSAAADDALRFAKWIASAEHGAPVFLKHHFTPAAVPAH
jgi:molybdate transport system substrate-binding protein